MAALSFDQVAQYAYQAGFRGKDLAIATAVVTPESGRDPSIVQKGQPYATTGWGLWQITPGNSFPDIGVDQALLDPETNARAAYRKYTNSGNSFRPWTTYTLGVYLLYMPQSQAAASNAGSGASSSAPLDFGISAAASKLVAAIQNGFEIFLGTGLIIAGALVILWQFPATRDVFHGARVVGEKAAEAAVAAAV